MKSKETIASSATTALIPLEVFFTCHCLRHSHRQCIRDSVVLKENVISLICNVYATFQSVDLHVYTSVCRHTMWWLVVNPHVLGPHKTYMYVCLCHTCSFTHNERAQFSVKLPFVVIVQFQFPLRMQCWQGVTLHPAISHAAVWAERSCVILHSIRPIQGNVAKCC